MRYERQQALFNSVEVLTEQLKQAVISANHIQEVNSNAKNITDTIHTFEGLKEDVDQVIVDVNKASAFCSKKTYIGLASVLILSILIGLGSGYFMFVKTIQTSVLQTQINELVQAKTDFAEQKRFIKKALDNGVIFYDNAVILPVPKDEIKNNSKGKVGYWYK